MKALEMLFTVLFYLGVLATVVYAIWEFGGGSEETWIDHYQISVPIIVGTALFYIVRRKLRR